MPALVSIDFARIVPHGGSTNFAFEEFCSQLARHVDVGDGVRFQRNGRGADLGLECAWTLRDGSVLGWQAKYVFDVDALKSQAEESFLSALQNHQRLSVYYVCVPFEPSAAPGRGRSQQQKLADYKREWEAIATQRGRAVTIEWWTPSGLTDRLLAIDAHGGRRLYWFGTPVFTDEWFSHHLAGAIAAAGPRYTPNPNVGHALDSVLSALGGTAEWLAEVNAWRKRIEELIRDGSESLAAAGSAGIREFPASAIPMTSNFKSTLERLAPRLVANRDASHWQDSTPLMNEADALQASLAAALQEALDSAHGSGSSTSKQFREFQAAYQAAFPAHHYDRIVHAGEELALLRQWLDSAQLHGYLRGALLIAGPAGIGKTHSLCDGALKRATNQERSILLHGQRFRSGPAWEQIRAHIGLGADWSAEALLDALDAAAETTGKPLIVFIDAVNESQPRQQWLAELPVLLSSMSAYPNLRVCISCRTGFLEQVIQEGVDIARFEHPGFAGIEFDACQSFFTHYDLEPPVGPLFDPEFSNPLFLKLICKTMRDSRQRRLPNGWTGFRTIFRGLLDARDRDWRTNHGNLVEKAVTRSLERLAEEMARRGARSLAVPEAIKLLDALGLAGATMLEHLLAEELIMQLPGSGERGVLTDPADEISFGYERLGDHLQVQIAIAALPENAPLPSRMLDIARAEPGYAEALAMQVPERYRSELLDLIDDEDACKAMHLPWVRALEWRDLATIGAPAERWLMKLLGSHETFDRAMDAALVLAMRPNAYLGSSWLSSLLRKPGMPQRDPMWCSYLHDAWDRELNNPVRRLVSTAWTSLGALDAELQLAWLRVLCWFFASCDRRVRDRATRAAVRIGEQNPSAWAVLAGELLDLDDDYVVERLLAAAYGTHLRVRDDAALCAVCDAIAPILQETERANALVRDYARCICDLALRRGLSICIGAESLRCPIGSEWPLSIPSDDEMAAYETDESQERYPRILESTTREFGGDFAKYTIPSAIRRYEKGIDVAAARRWVFRHVLHLGYSENAAGFDWQLMRKHGAGRSRSRWAERVGKKYEWISLARLLGRLGDHVVPKRETYTDAIHSPLTAAVLRDLDVSIDGNPVSEEQQARYRRDESDLMTGTVSDDEVWVADTTQITMLEDGFWNLEHLGTTDWYPLEAHVTLVDPNEREGDRGFRRQAWVQIRSYLVSSSDFERTWRWARTRNFDGGWMPKGWEISDRVFVGEYPRGIVLGDSGLPDLRGFVPQQWPRDRSGAAAGSGPEHAPATLIPTTHYLQAEFENDCSDANYRRVCVPVPQLVGPLVWNTKGGFLTASGETVFSDPSVDANGPAGCFVKKAFMTEYLAQRRLSLLWTVLSEKLPGDYETVPRLEYSHVRGLHDGKVRGAKEPVLFRS